VIKKVYVAPKISDIYYIPSKDIMVLSDGGAEGQLRSYRWNEMSVYQSNQDE